MTTRKEAERTRAPPPTMYRIALIIKLGCSYTDRLCRPKKSVQTHEFLTRSDKSADKSVRVRAALECVIVRDVRMCDGVTG